MLHLDVGHEVEISYKGKDYSIGNYGDYMWVFDKKYYFDATTNAEMVEKFVHTPIFPDGKSIFEADAEITFTFSSNDIDEDHYS